MKTQNNIVTIENLNKEIKKLNLQINKMKNDFNEVGETLHNIGFKLRKDIPFIFQNESGNELFKTFNLNMLPKIDEKINLRPSPDSCCLNKYLINEFNLTEEQLTQHILENQTSFSFFVKDISTNIIVFDSHPEDEWDDSNCINFDEDEYNIKYIITLTPNNIIKKEVLIEKIKN